MCYLSTWHGITIRSSVHFQVTVSFDETTTLEDVDKLFKIFSGGKPVNASNLRLISNEDYWSIVCLELC